MLQIPLFDAKNRLSEVLRGVESGDPVELTRHGKPVAVILDSESYSNLQSEQGSFGRLYQRFTQEWPADDTDRPGTGAATDVDQDDPFSGIRSTDTGRVVEL